ncbi:MAG TPA: nucleoside transporter C-terminal domain-containing protein [bacterium]|nr:nucleoside transporter C-terminal domain-containing protein [bacterium]
MRLISILGIIVLLGLAYLMSNNKRIIPWRIILYGVSLQVLLGTIVLMENMLSYIGIFVFFTWIILFLFLRRFDPESLIPKPLITVQVVLGSALSVTMFYFLQRWGIALWLCFLLGGWFLYNSLRKRYSFQPVVVGLLLTGLLGVMLQEQIYGRELFQAFSMQVDAFLRLTDLGSRFLFGQIVSQKFQDMWGYQFAFVVLPTIIFFAACMSILYHLGIMQRVIRAVAKFMQWTMGTSGSETLSCSANIFVGMTEAPLLIKPFLARMTQSELLTIMLGGFATIAGSVLAGYIRMGIDPTHLIAASVMSAPAALVMGKIIFPETEESETSGEVEIPYESESVNLIDAAASGVWDGLKLAVNVGAILIAFIALIGVVDVVLNWGDVLVDGHLLNGPYLKYDRVGFSPNTGEYTGVFPGSLKTLFGTILRPIAWVMGVGWEYADEVGNLLGIKITLNELVAYATLSQELGTQVLSQRAEIIATYALCGFANFSSIGIQIGGIAALAPDRRSDLARLALRAMFGGALASWMTATIAGIMIA